MAGWRTCGTAACVTLTIFLNAPPRRRRQRSRPQRLPPRLPRRGVGQGAARGRARRNQGAARRRKNLPRRRKELPRHSVHEQRGPRELVGLRVLRAPVWRVARAAAHARRVKFGTEWGAGGAHVRASLSAESGSVLCVLSVHEFAAPITSKRVARDARLVHGRARGARVYADARPVGLRARALKAQRHAIEYEARDALGEEDVRRRRLEV